MTQGDGQELAPIQVDLTDIVGELEPGSIRIYQHDAQVFAEWIIEQQLLPSTLTRSHIIAYRSYLLRRYARSTAQRVFSVAHRITKELVYKDVLIRDPFEGVRWIIAQDETTHTALTQKQVKELLATIDINTKIGQRDYLIIKLMARTGLRRSECANIKLGDLTMDRGHHILMLPETKSQKRQLVKIPVDIHRLIEEYKECIGIQNAPASQPLFVGFEKGDRPTLQGIDSKGKLIWRLVKYYAKQIGVDLTPHGLRATFITLALDEDVSLHKVQYAARHQHPQTTERYHTRKINLDNNAVDALDF